MAFSEPCISIPVQDSDELVLISATELPVEPEDLLDLLRGEYAPLHLWLDFAKAYLANGKVNWSPHMSTCMPCIALFNGPGRCKLHLHPIFNGPVSHAIC